MRSLLLVVDPQIDFINGALPVPGAADAMNKLASYLGSSGHVMKIVTYDAHPWDHCSFKSEGGQWPRHCARHSQGAAIWPDLLEALHESPGESLFLPKGQDREREEYSIFKNAQAATAIQRAINDNAIDVIEICGIAGDICVLDTLKDGVELLGAGKFRPLPDFSPSLDGGNALEAYWREVNK